MEVVRRIRQLWNQITKYTEKENIIIVILNS